MQSIKTSALMGTGKQTQWITLFGVCLVAFLGVVTQGKRCLTKSDCILQIGDYNFSLGFCCKQRECMSWAYLHKCFPKLFKPPNRPAPAPSPPKPLSTLKTPLNQDPRSTSTARPTTQAKLSVMTEWEDDDGKHNSKQESNGSGSISTGIVLGGTVGVIVLIAITVLLYIRCFKSKRREAPRAPTVIITRRRDSSSGADDNSRGFLRPLSFANVESEIPINSLDGDSRHLRRDEDLPSYEDLYAPVREDSRPSLLTAGRENGSSPSLAERGSGSPPSYESCSGHQNSFQPSANIPAIQPYNYEDDLTPPPRYEDVV